jgi:hypothetical protein
MPDLTDAEVEKRIAERMGYSARDLMVDNPQGLPFRPYMRYRLEYVSGDECKMCHGEGGTEKEAWFSAPRYCSDRNALSPVLERIAADTDRCPSFRTAFSLGIYRALNGATAVADILTLPTPTIARAALEALEVVQ